MHDLWTASSLDDRGPISGRCLSIYLQHACSAEKLHARLAPVAGAVPFGLLPCRRDSHSTKAGSVRESWSPVFIPAIWERHFGNQDGDYHAMEVCQLMKHCMGLRHPCGRMTKFLSSQRPAIANPASQSSGVIVLPRHARPTKSH